MTTESTAENRIIAALQKAVELVISRTILPKEITITPVTQHSHEEDIYARQSATLLDSLGQKNPDGETYHDATLKHLDTRPNPVIGLDIRLPLSDEQLSNAAQSIARLTGTKTAVVGRKQGKNIRFNGTIEQLAAIETQIPSLVSELLQRTSSQASATRG